ncbi:hypothetical protein HDU93_010021 [Gonapodya sp. JEL0774]|nr:hypothetical protein HDU93_010021 [Gonapodya sp. JEL0774]
MLFAGIQVLGKVEGEGKLWHGHVTAVTVAPEYRRLGMAERMMGILEEVSERIHNAYFVDLFVRASNSVAIDMYTKFGYSMYRTVLKYYNAPPGGTEEDAFVDGPLYVYPSGSPKSRGAMTVGYLRVRDKTRRLAPTEQNRAKRQSSREPCLAPSEAPLGAVWEQEQANQGPGMEPPSSLGDESLPLGSVPVTSGTSRPRYSQSTRRSHQSLLISRRPPLRAGHSSSSVPYPVDAYSDDATFADLPPLPTLATSAPITSLATPRIGRNDIRDDVEFVKHAPLKHPARSSIQHWQLRDLLTCTTNSREFVYVNQNNVVTYNTETKQSTPAFKDLAFSPSSIASGCGYLAAGGQRSQLIVRQHNNNWFAQTAVGGSINNAISISRHLGDVRLMVCNNDETIKVYSLPTLEKVASISLPTAVNYAAVSPDGRKMVAVGDSNQAFLYELSNNTYNKVASLTTSNDAGFSCSWNHSSDKFAVASQDGFVNVWDVRSSEKLCQIASKQSPQVKGACRSVKFSPTGSIDLLIYSEHVSYFSLVDARTFNERQTIRVVPPGADAHISGLAFAPDSRTVYVGTESSVLEYDVDTLSRRSFGSGSFL